MRVFWPSNIASSSSSSGGGDALLVGWANDGGDVVVVCALPASLGRAAAVELLDHHNDLLLTEPPRRSRKTAAARLSIVGVLAGPDATKSGSSSTSTGSIGTGSDTGIIVRAGALVHPPLAVLVQFDPPNTALMEFLTLRPSVLYKPIDDDDDGNGKNGAAKRKLSLGLQYHAEHRAPKADNMALCIDQINCVHELQPLLRQLAASDGTLVEERDEQPQPQPQPQPQLQPQQQPQQQPQPRQRRNSLGHDVIAQVVTNDPVFRIVMWLREVIERLLVLLETARVGRVSVLAVFCTAQQVHLWLNQMCYVPLEYAAIQRRRQRLAGARAPAAAPAAAALALAALPEPEPERFNAYIRFSNQLWLYLNDLLLGIYAFQLLRAHAAEIVDGAYRVFARFMIGLLLRASAWMTMFPAGLKLNPQLGCFIGDVTNWTVQTWSAFGSQLLFRPAVVRVCVNVVGISGVLGGLTLQISLLVDLVALAGFHIFLLHQCLARVYAQQLSTLGSLFRLFRGLKYNRLRQRVDHGNYDMHQLFLGTILFTVSLFLLPTLFAFYAVFTVARLAVFATVGVLCVMLAFLNHFPLVPLLLRLKAPRRIPTGVYFTHDPAPAAAAAAPPPPPTSAAVPPTPTLYLHSKPMALTEIFQQYTSAVKQFTNKTFDLRALGGLLTGRSLQLQQDALYAPLYTVLPRRRVSVEETRRLLKECFA